jgi:hypothetical protein
MTLIPAGLSHHVSAKPASNIRGQDCAGSRWLAAVRGTRAPTPLPCRQLGRDTAALAAIDLGLLHPLMQRLRNATDPLFGNRYHSCPSRVVIPLVVENHPYRAFANLRRKLIHCLANTGSTFSGVGASGKLGAVHISQTSRSAQTA